MVSVWVAKQAVMAATKSLRIKGWRHSNFNVWVPGKTGRILLSYGHEATQRVIFYPPAPSTKIVLQIPVKAIMLDKEWVKRYIPSMSLSHWGLVKTLLEGKDSERWLESPETK